MKRDDLDRVLGEIAVSVAKRRPDECQSLLYNDLRQIIVSDGEVLPPMLRALREVPLISRDRRFIESYLGAFAYCYKFAIRRLVGLFSPPVEFCFGCDVEQRFFLEFKNLLNSNINECGVRQRMYYCAIVNGPTQNLRYALDVIFGGSVSRVAKKNAAVLLCHSVWRRSTLKNSVPLLDDMGCGSRRITSTANLYLGRLSFKSALALVREATDEDRELEWCQSFGSVVAVLGLLWAYPCEQAIDLVFSEIKRLRDLPVSRGYEYEFDAYKCLNEDAALIIEKWSAKGGARWQRLIGYFLLQARKFGLQSHELLRCGTLVSSSERVVARRKIKIYDYEAEIVPRGRRLLGFGHARR